MMIHIPATKFFTYTLDVSGGFTLGKSLNNYYKYGLGGIFEQNLGNFSQFYGYEFGEIFSENILSASNRFQFKLNKNLFLIGSINFANQFEDINVENAFKINESSAGITAGYKSPFGQIKLNYSAPLKNEKGIFSVVLGHWF